jgi:hypothetical protein
MGDGSADDTIEMLKDIMYGRPKSENQLAQTERGSKAWDAMKKEVDESTGVVFIPSDDPDLSGITIEKFDWDAPKRLRKGSKCPTCKAGNLIPIIYGMPGRELMDQSGRGEIELGGCVVSQVFDPELGFISGDPELSCPKCEGRFFRRNGHVAQRAKD